MAEDLPQENDIDAILETIVGSEWQRAVFVMNCQVGLGHLSKSIAHTGPLSVP